MIRSGIFDQVTAEREATRTLFRIVHDVALEQAGRPVREVVAALRGRLPGTPRLDDIEIIRIAEQISVGLDPTGL
ncbi:hypothetical protein J5X84_07620 [Streptosporangiaceae bacterium NEAU-GS5]|nr:hypothetical protein [Streptosporangiaceae bacterium NEAU-GS5]